MHRPTKQLQFRAMTLLVLFALNAGYGIWSLTAFAPEFDGPPEFIPIDGHSIQYATNTAHTVLSIGPDYYLWRDGKWFLSSAPAGPYSRLDAPLAALRTLPH
jgi:hypothetical protein